jgi:hypothetical protein
MKVDNLDRDTLKRWTIISEALLEGFWIQDKAGAPVHQYYRVDDERLARRVLADLLYSKEPIPREVRDALARLIDPDPHPWAAPERTLEFRFRSRGNRRNFARRLHIGREVYDFVKQGVKTESAIADVRKRHSLSRAEVFKHWASYKRGQQLSAKGLLGSLLSEIDD